MYNMKTILEDTVPYFPADLRSLRRPLKDAALSYFLSLALSRSSAHPLPYTILLATFLLPGRRESLEVLQTWSIE